MSRGIFGYQLKYDLTDEHYLKRLGAALVVKWTSLPEEVQHRLVEQAGLMFDRDVSSAGIERFIQRTQPRLGTIPIAARA